MTKLKSKTARTSIKLPTTKDLLEAGAHFGHETKRWHPNYEKYIYTKRGGFHVIDIEKTLSLLKEALAYLEKVSGSGSVLFVGTKRQARDIVEEEAIRSGAYFITNRWVGGLLTNFETVHKGIKRLRELESILEGDVSEYSQQILSQLRKEWGRLKRLYGGIKNLDDHPKAVVIFDPKYERIAVREAKLKEVPIISLVDSNTDPTGIDYPVPANDDAIKSIQLFMKAFADAVLAGNKGNGVKHNLKDYSHVGISDKSKKSKAKKDTKKVEKKEKKIRTKVSKKKPKSTKSKKEKKSKSILKEVDGRTKSALQEAKVTDEQLNDMSDEEILDIKGIGKVGLKEIRDAQK